MNALEEARRREERERAEAVEAEARRAEERARAAAEAANAPKVEAKAAPEPVAAPEAAPAPAPAPTPEPAPAPPPQPVEIQLDPSRPAPRRFTPVQRPEIPKPQPKPEPQPQERPAAAAPAASTGSAAPRTAPSAGGLAPRRPAEPARPQQRDRKADDRRQSGKLTVNRALGDNDGARARSLAALKRAREKEHRRSYGGAREPQAKQVRDVVVPEAITVQELANRMAEKGSDLVKALFKMGMPVTITQTIDQDTAELLVTEFGHNIVRVSDADIDLAADTVEDAEDTLQTRPPVVTIMSPRAPISAHSRATSRSHWARSATSRCSAAPRLAPSRSIPRFRWTNWPMPLRPARLNTFSCH